MEMPFSGVQLQLLTATGALVCCVCSFIFKYRYFLQVFTWPINTGVLLIGENVVVFFFFFFPEWWVWKCSLGSKRFILLSVNCSMKSSQCASNGQEFPVSLIILVKRVKIFPRSD